MADNTAKPPPSPEQMEQDAQALLEAGDRIMRAIAADITIDLNDPIDLLALQLLGPCLSLAMGESGATLRVVMENLVGIAECVDVERLRLLLQQGVRIV